MTQKNLRKVSQTNTSDKVYICKLKSCNKRFNESSDFTAHEKAHKEQLYGDTPYSLSKKNENMSHSMDGCLEHSADLGHTKGRCLEREIDAAISGTKEKCKDHNKIVSKNNNDTTKNYFVNNYDFLSRTEDVFKVKKIFRKNSQAREVSTNDRKRPRPSDASQVLQKHSVQKVTENTKEASDKKTFKITKNSEKSYIHKDSPEYDTD